MFESLISQSVFLIVCVRAWGDNVDVLAMGLRNLDFGQKDGGALQFQIILDVINVWLLNDPFPTTC